VTSAEPRDGKQRRIDTERLLSASESNAWVSTASKDSEPHLVRLSFVWRQPEILRATDLESPTAKNLARRGGARLALGTTRDVVLIVAELRASYPVNEAPDAFGSADAAQADWDPTTAGPSDGSFVLQPLQDSGVARIQ
jgi:hypothetical protein